MSMRLRFRRWRFRRAFRRLGWPEDRVGYVAKIAAALDVSPRVIGGPPGLNHWSAWGPTDSTPSCVYPSEAAVRGWHADRVWLDEAPSPCRRGGPA